jgi:hypothetical protein
MFFVEINFGKVLVDKDRARRARSSLAGKE